MQNTESKGLSKPYESYEYENKPLGLEWKQTNLQTAQDSDQIKPVM